MPVVSGVVGMVALAALGCQGASPEPPGLTLIGEPIAVGQGPSAVAAGDLNGDGNVDLVVANALSHDLTVLVGDGRGNFTSHGTFPAGENPDDVALGDFDLDGDLDAAIANHETQHLTLLLNDGASRFQPAPASPLPIAARPHPHAVRAFDVDHDGLLDLLVDDRAGRGVEILRGLGDAMFAAPGTRIDMGGDPYRGMAIGDVNGDGQVDLVTPNPSAVAIALGESGLAFRSPTSIPSDRPFAVGVGDLTGDGRLDVVVATEPGMVSVLVGLGDGRVAPDAALAWRMPAGAKGVAVGDVNGDGVADAAITNWGPPTVWVLFGGERVTTAEAFGGENPWGLVLADLTGDGADELVVLDFAAGLARVYSSVGD